MKGSYENADGGFSETGIRAFVGCPVYGYSNADNTEFPEEVWEFLKTSDELDWILSATTNGGSDEKKNECGIAMSHAYSIISIFTVGEHNLAMIRNPWGRTDYTEDWNFEDPNWT